MLLINNSPSQVLQRGAVLVFPSLLISMGTFVKEKGPLFYEKKEIKEKLL